MGVYALVWGAAMTGAAFQWTTSEVGMQRTAQVSLAAVLLAAIVLVLGLLLVRTSKAERRRKQAMLERRWQARPAPHTRSVTQRRDSPDVAP